MVTSRSRRGEDGYNLVILIVAITILNILVAVALPLWSYTIRREREEETIFRGLQYAEAIRVFRQRFGRYPSSMEELVKVEPRSIRQLWKEPLSEDGEFGLMVEAPPPGANPSLGSTPPPGGQSPSELAVAQPTPAPGGSNPFGGFGIGGGGRAQLNLVKLPRAKDGGKTLTSGAPLSIHGVYLDREGQALRKFFGQDKYEDWIFTAELIKPPVTAPGRPLPRVADDWLGKTFPDGLAPTLGGSGLGPGGASTIGQPVGEGSAPGKPEASGEGGEGDTIEAPSDPNPPDFSLETPLDEPVPEDEATPDEEPMPEDEPIPEDDVPQDDVPQDDVPQDQAFSASPDLASAPAR